MVLIDEMQDTSARQAALLGRAIPRQSVRTVIQRVGDPNQRIFEVSDAGSESRDPYPDRNRCIDIPNSYRFGSGIASLASPFAVRRVGVDGLSGIRREEGKESDGGRHAIFVFPDDCTDGVIEAFGRHAIDVIGDTLVRDGSIVAIGHVHNKDAIVGPKHRHYPKSVGDYWEGYAGGQALKERHPRSFVEYVWLAQSVVGEGRSFAPGVERIASATVEVARRVGDVGNLRLRGRTHRAVLEALSGDNCAVGEYREMVKRFVIDRSGKQLSEDDWRVDRELVISVAECLCTGATDRSKAESFMQWPGDGGSAICAGDGLSGQGISNVCRVQAGRGEVEIRLGSIHWVWVSN